MLHQINYLRMNQSKPWLVHTHHGFLQLTSHSLMMTPKLQLLSELELEMIWVVVYSFKYGHDNFVFFEMNSYTMTLERKKTVTLFSIWFVPLYLLSTSRTLPSPVSSESQSSVSLWVFHLLMIWMLFIAFILHNKWYRYRYNIWTMWYCNFWRINHSQLPYLLLSLITWNLIW